MKVISEEHFKEMELLCRIFDERSKLHELYLPEYEASRLINEMIQTIDDPQEIHFQKVAGLLKDVDHVPHANGAAWLDYTLHVMATLRANGFS